MAEMTCAAGERCRDYDHTRDQPAWTWDAPLCAECLRAGERAVQQLVYDYRDLEQHLPRLPSQRLDGQPGHSSEHPTPLREDVDALQRAIWWVAVTWAEILADRHRLGGLSKRVRDGWAVVWAARIIGPRVHDLACVGTQELSDYPLTTEDGAIRHRSVALAYIGGAQAVLDLTWLHERARSVLGLTRLVRRLPGTCANPRCERPALEQENGSEKVSCGHCGNTETRDDYERRHNLFRRDS